MPSTISTSLLTRCQLPWDFILGHRVLFLATPLRQCVECIKGGSSDKKTERAFSEGKKLVQSGSRDNLIGKAPFPVCWPPLSLSLTPFSQFLSSIHWPTFSYQREIKRKPSFCLCKMQSAKISFPVTMTMSYFRLKAIP